MKEDIQTVHPIDLLQPYRQQHEYSCGPASLVMAYRCFDIKYTEQEIINYMGIDKHGMDWQAMMEFVADSGMNLTFQSDATLQDVRKFYHQHHSPIIVAWNPTLKKDEDHFSLIKNPDGYMLQIADPADGAILTVGENSFMKRWHGAGRERSFMGIYK